MARRQARPNKKTLPGRLRIVAGNWRSRLLDIADVPGLRPTSERIRETLFNWLAPHIQGARCLDLFAGTGALGLEALSRGAAESVFVETSAKALATLRHNIEDLKAEGATVIAASAFDYLEAGGVGKFDVVFLDPPFGEDLLARTCELLERSGALPEGGLVYIEEQKLRPLPELPAGWSVLKERTAGNVRYALVTVDA
jgi:16S rRNA (guanine966-N2)-methyltransferase